MKGLTILVLASLPMLASAQSNGYSRGHGYVYFAPGFASADGQTRGMAHLGAGGEGFFTRNLGLGAELGYLTPIRSWSDGVGTFSPNFVARFRAKDNDNKIEPFVTGGYTLFFRSGTVNGVNFGGGANYWFKEKVGLRFEVRDNLMLPPDLDVTTHYVGFRIGLTFR